MHRDLTETMKCLALLTTVLALTACNDGALTHKDVSQTIPPTTVTGNPTGGTLPTEFPPVSVNVTTEPGYDEDDFDYIQSIQVDRLTLTITPESDQDANEDGIPDNFDFASSVELYIIANLNGNQPSEALLGSVPAGNTQLSSAQRSITVAMTNIDISPYVQAPGGYQVQIRGTGNLPPDDVIFTGLANYRIGLGFF